MPCNFYGNAVICMATTFTYRGYWTCPTQKLKCRVVFEDALWYGLTRYCCGCGEVWDTEGARRKPPRPEKRGAAMAKHREMWKVAHTPAEHRQWFYEQVG